MKGLSQLNDMRRRFVAWVRGTWKVLGEVNGIVMGVDKTFVRMTRAAIVLGGLTSLFSLAMIGVFLQRFASSYVSAGKVPLSLILAGIAFYALWRFCVRFVREYGRARERLFNRRLRIEIEQRRVEKLLELDLGRLIDPAFLEVKESTEERGEESITELWKVRATLVAVLIGLVVSIGIMASLDAWLIVMAIAPVAIQTVKAVLAERWHREMYEKHMVTRRRKWHLRNCLSDESRLTHVRLFRFLRFVMRRFCLVRDELWDSEREVIRKELRIEVLVSLAECLMVGLAMAYIGLRVSQGAFSISQIFVIIGTVQLIGRSWYSFSSAFVELNSKLADYGYLRKFYETKPLVDESDARECRIVGVPSVAVESVSFSYPHKDRLALDGCSLAVAPGEKICLVGRNGSGKTTLLRVLTKVYAPSAGRVLVNGQDLQGIRQSSWLESVLYVTQETSGPKLCIDEAIAGVPRPEIDRTRLARAVSLAMVDEFALDLPHGLETQIGAEWPDGVDFSEGQKQRIKLAAAFYRLLDPQVSVVLFDEPMSHCDTEVKERFYAAIRTIPDKTIIVVSHDPLYLQHFDRVVVMEKGKVVRNITDADEIVAYRSELVYALMD